MRKLRYCKKCGKVFEALGKFGRVCVDCNTSKGGRYTRNHQISRYVKRSVPKSYFSTINTE